MAYSKKVVERFENVLKNPEAHSVGRFDPKDPNVATGMVGAPACGDVMKLDLKMKGDVIEDVKFKTYGCGSAIASSSMFVDMMMGKTIEEAKLIKDKDIADALELGGELFNKHHWQIHPCSAVTGKGLVEGMDWIVDDISSRIFLSD